MEILYSVAASFAQYTVGPIVRHVGYLLSYKDNFKKLEDRLRELNDTKAGIIRLAEAERRKGNEIVTDVQYWLDKADRMTDTVQQLRENPCRAEAGCSKCSFSSLWWRHQLSREAEKVAKTVSDVKDEGKFNGGTVGYLPALAGVGCASAVRRLIDFESRKPIMKAIMEALADHKVSSLGVYGLGGVGKSSLVEQIAGRVMEHKLFDVVVKADVTKSPDYKRIQGEIADLLGLQFNEETVLGRSLRLRERIKKEKAILIILDDIWDTIELEAVGIPYRGKVHLEKGGTFAGDEDDPVGCKFLFISRHEDVLNKMVSQKNFRLDLLTEIETLRLFEFMAGDVVKDPSLRHTATQLAKRCSGLPVVIVTVARALNNKDIHAWKDALNQLERVDNRELHEITYSALELSYNSLQSEEVKAIFLLCGVLGPHLRVEYLLKCVLGLRIFKPVRTLEDGRNRLYNMIGSLKASCLLFEGDTSAEVKMHDVVHEVAMSIASRDQRVFMIKSHNELKVWPANDFLKRCPQIILNDCHIQKLPERLCCPQLKFFYLYSSNSSLQIPDSLFEGMGSLNMLDLSCMNLSSLPGSVRSLLNLQTLCLDLCALGDIAAIGALRNLEILSLYQSSLTKLPSEIGQLAHLRMLDLSNSEIEVLPPNILSKLTKLEELYMGNTFIKWEPDDSSRPNSNASLAELRQLPNLTALDIQIREPWILPRDLMFEKMERFKITIGDGWEWFGNYETSKGMKLKLPTSIHLEHGIKALMKLVEDLYLSEISGVSNVLYQLNGQGFPLLKRLHIQNNANILHIINSVEWSQAQDSFPNLNKLVLYNLCNLEKVCYGPLTINSFSKLRVVKVKNCHQLLYLFSSSMVKSLSQLLVINVSMCNSMNKIVFMESVSSASHDIIDKIEFCQVSTLSLHHLPRLGDFHSEELTTYIRMPFFSTMVSFPKLECLKLSSINLSKIWDDDQPLMSYSIQNLTNLIVEDCAEIKYLFSSSIIGSFLSLKRLEISKCDIMEEIISRKEERNNGVALEEVRFPKLETIIINDMKNLKTVWHCQFDRLKAMEVKNCDKVVIVFPSHMMRKFHSLETLTVSDCNSVEKIFDLNANEMCSAELIMQLKKLTLLRLQKLEQIWSRDPQGTVRFQNLQVVNVEDCQNLQYLFPLTIATSLQQLGEIIIKQAQGMTEIVAKKEEPMDRIVVFVFDQLTSLVLWNLPKLERFYAGNHTLACPSLREIFVFDCIKLNLFKTHSTTNQGPTADGILNLSMQQSLFTIEEFIPTLEQLTLNSKDVNMLLQGHFSKEYLFINIKLLRLYDFEDEEATFPYWFLKNVPNLKWLIVDYSSFKEIFENERLAGEEGPADRITCTRVKKLTLCGLHELHHICEGLKMDPVLEDLESLNVHDCPNLRNLAPSSDSFNHLTYLKVDHCNGLKNLITAQTARSLVNLQVMKITDCNLLEEIVTEKGDVTKDNISFNRLESLELISLPRLARFCSSKCFLKFQLLEEVVLQQCPRMQKFSEGDTSTPSLRKVRVEDGEEWCWEGDLNLTIKKLFIDLVAFRSFRHLNLLEYPDLKDVWYRQFPHNVFVNLKSLVVHKCNFLSDKLFSSNLLEVLHRLEKLEVSDCDSLEVIFDGNGIDGKGKRFKETAQLKNLTLSALPNLKQIWKSFSEEILKFGSLCVVHVNECQSLINLFPISICQYLQHLEELVIDSCGVEEIVAMENASEEHQFNFPKLTTIILWSMTRLRSFYPEKHVLNCPSLKTLSVYHCEALRVFDYDCSNSQLPHQRVFDYDCSNSQLPHQVGEVDTSIQHALFSFEKICPNLEQIGLNEADVATIWNGHFPASIFGKVDFLSLQCFHEATNNFPYGFIHKFLNLETLQVYCSSFEVLFPLEAIGQSMKIRKLLLFNLEQLKNIWNTDSLLDPLDLKLEDLQIVDCSNLVQLVPRSTSLKTLTNLDVAKCKGLIYLITSSSAESLAQLTRMTIINCEMMEDIVHTDEEVEDIKFEKLQYLQLTSLSSLKSFCCGKHNFIFPNLQRLIVTGCPKMKIFSSGNITAPMLKTVEVENGKKCWKGDLNTTMKKFPQTRGE